MSAHISSDALRDVIYSAYSGGGLGLHAIENDPDDARLGPDSTIPVKNTAGAFFSRSFAAFSVGEELTRIKLGVVPPNGEACALPQPQRHSAIVRGVFEIRREWQKRVWRHLRVTNPRQTRSRTITTGI